MGTAKDNFDDSMQYMRALAETVAKVLDMLKDAIDQDIRYKDKVWMLKNMKQCEMYPVKGKCLNELKTDLDKKGIPYIDFNTGRNELYIKRDNLEEVQDINKQILITRTNYYQEVPGDDLERAIAKSPAVKDKDILSLHNLNKYQCEVLKNKCNDITKGFMVGVNKDDEISSTISVHAPWTISDDLDKTDFCKAYLEMAFSLHGPNAVLKMQQVDADEKLDKEVESLKGCKDTHYVIGVDDPTKYIELNANGFEMHRLRIENGEIKNSQVTTVDKDSPDYEKELQKCMDSIYNKAVIDNEETLQKHINIKERNVETNRPEKNKEQKILSRMETDLSSQINKMIKTGPKAEMLKECAKTGFANEAFELYQQEAKKILTAVIDKTPLIGYEDKDVKKMEQLFKDAKADPSDYKSVLGALQGYDVEQHRARDEVKEKDKKKDKARDDDERTR